MKTKLFIAAILLLPFLAEAQFGDLVKKGMKKALDKGKGQALKNFEAERAKLDSSDFNYAISVIDNSGMMSIRDSKEGAIKKADIILNTGDTGLKNKSDVTPEQKCRGDLDVAEELYDRKRLKLAEGAFITAKQSYESNNLTGNINYSKVIADMGLLYATMGRYDLAKKYTPQALEIREKTLTKKSKAYAASLNNNAVLNQDLGQYNEAEQFFQDAVQTVKEQVGEKTQEYATVLNNQAIFFAKIGRVDQAIEKSKTAIDILNQLNVKDDHTTVGFQSNLALLYQQTGKLADAESIYLKLENSLKAFSDNPYYGGVLDNLGLLYIQMGKLDKVEGYFVKSAGVYKTRSQVGYAKVLNDLGNFYRMQGRFDEAEQKLTESLNIRATQLDINHPDYVKSEEDMGILHWKKGDLEKAYTNLQSAMNKSLDFVDRFFPPMSEAEKTKYWDVLQPRFQRFFNYCLDAQAKNSAIVNDMYNYQIATKALLLNSTNKIKQSILGSGNADLIKDYTAWLDKKETLARYYSLSKAELVEQKIDLPALEQEANDMERALSQKSADFAQGYTADRITFNKIASLLTDNEAVVELIRIRSFDKDFTSDSKYAALVLVKNSTEPKLTVLDNGNQLETRYAKYYRNSIKQKANDEFSYDQFWARIEGAMAGKKTIYISPDGVFNQINLNTLKKTGGDFLLNKYDFAIVGNSKDLIGLKNQKTSTPKKDAFLLGFPNYGGATIPALPGTKVEVEGISRILKTTGYQVTLPQQNDATESKIKSLNGPAMVHIATHGYFLEDGAVGVASENAKDNPLLRSGLLLAGASKTMSGEVLPNLESNDNGVLTAYEAMNLNLNGTNLLVMSACETGLGDVRAGEGVYGLQRAFIVAGAKALVMSLWKVDDAATQALMTNFYTNLSKGGSKLKAFKQAQQQLMLKYKDPYYWGAFVMVGM